MRRSSLLSMLFAAALSVQTVNANYDIHRDTPGTMTYGVQIRYEGDCPNQIVWVWGGGEENEVWKIGPNEEASHRCGFTYTNWHTFATRASRRVWVKIWRGREEVNKLHIDVPPRKVY